MRLRVEKGVNAGREFEMESALVTIGRAADNDIILSDEMVSQHHAKIWRDVDGKVSVTDMDSVNGTEVNGRQIKTAELRPGDRLLFGKSVLRLVDEPAPVAPKKAAPAERKPAGVIDLGFEKKEEAAEKGQGRGAAPRFISKRVLVVLVCAVAAVAVALLIRVAPTATGWFKRSPRAVSVNPALASVQSGTEIYYENVIGSTTGQKGPNIRRTEIHVKGPKLSIAIDDVKQQLKVRRDVELKPAELKQLLESMDLDALARTERRVYVGASEPGTYAQMDLRVTRGPDYFRFLVRNTRPPEVLLGSVDSFETQVQIAGGVVIAPPERTISQAREAFENAERNRNEAQVAPDRLFKAVKLYQQVVEALKDFDPKPVPYEEARRRFLECDQQVTNRVNDVFQQAQVLIQLKDWDGAHRKLELIRQMVPDESDPRNKLAYEELIRKVMPNIKQR